MGGEAKNWDRMTVSAAVWLLYNNSNTNAKAQMDIQNCTDRGKKEIAMQLISLEHVRWKLLVIHLYMRSSCTPAHSWHQWFGFVTIYTLFRFVWLLFICRRKSVSKQHFWCCSKYSFLESDTGMRREKENDKERNCACVNAPFLLWIILKTASDHLIGFGTWSMETVPFVSGCISFSTTFLPPYLPLTRSPVSDSKLQRAFW